MFEWFEKTEIAHEIDKAADLLGKRKLEKILLKELKYNLDDWCYDYKYGPGLATSVDHYKFINKKNGFTFSVEFQMLIVKYPYKKEISLNRKLRDKFEKVIADLFDIGGEQQSTHLIDFLEGKFNNAVSIKYNDIISIKNWLTENITNKYSIKIHTSGERPLSEACMTLWFDSPEDAVLFKLSHSENLVERNPIQIQGYELKTDSGGYEF